MGWQVARVRGISVQVHWTLLVVLPLFAYLIAVQYFDGGGLDAASLAWGAALAVTLFLSVLLHEFSHSLAAIRRGVRVPSILLMPLGGISQMESTPGSPRDEAVITVVGPLTNYVLAGPLLLAAYLLPVSGDPFLFLMWAGWLNVGLGTFNLLVPAFPMDGGRLLRAGLASRVGTLKATQAAARVGRALAVVMGIAGVLAFGFGGIWLILIAFFIYAGAGAEERMITARHLLSDVSARDLMSEGPDSVSPDDDVERLVQRMLRTRHLSLPVMEGDRVVGCVGHDAVADVPPDGRSSVKVRDIMRTDIGSIDAGAPANDVLEAVQKEAHHHVIVTDHERPVGIVSGTDLERMVRLMQLRRMGQ